MRGWRGRHSGVRSGSWLRKLGLHGLELRLELKLKELQGTATLVVPAAAAKALGAIDFPLGVVVDHGGVVRFIGPIPADAFNGDGYVSKVLTRMLGKAAGTPAAH